MDFNYIESLVCRVKKGDATATSALLESFKPLIVNQAVKFKIDGYETGDLINECYGVLLSCVYKYKLGSYSFVSYGTMAIKNCLKNLLRNTEKRRFIDGTENLVVSEVLEDSIVDDFNIEEATINRYLRRFLRAHLNKLSVEDRELVHFVYFKNNSIRAFALKKNVKYHIAFHQNKRILQDLRICLKG